MELHLDGSGMYQCLCSFSEAMVSVIKLITVIYIGSLMVCDSI